MHWTDAGGHASDEAVCTEDQAMGEIKRRDFITATAGAVALGGLASPGSAVAADSGNQPTMERSAMEIQRIGITEPTGGIPVISFATVHAGLVYVCGVTADPNQLGDVRDQTRQVLDRIDRLLARAGTGKSKLLSAQVWLTDMNLFADHNEAWNAWVDPKNPPVRACLHSPALWRPGMLVEIMATAAL
jgi:enamine deaminase RidA (YjgF/YER057c/UK114 family)